MPIIFAGPILAVVGWLFFHIDAEKVPWLGWLQNYGKLLKEGYQNPSVSYLVTYALLIVFFSFFWVATQFNAVRIADDLKSSNGYIPGIRPGLPTAEFLDLTMTRVTFIGCVGLVLIAIIPSWTRCARSSRSSSCAPTTASSSTAASAAATDSPRT